MAFTTATALNDAAIRTLQAVTQPAAGAFYTDPVFGTRVLRLTDAAIGDGSHNPYSYWSPFNLDSTMLFTQFWPTGGRGSNAIATVWDFNPTTGAPSNKRSLQTGTTLTQEGLIWSHLDRNLLYGVTGTDLKLYSLVPGGSPTVVVDLTSRIQAVLAGASNLWQMSMGGSDRYFAWTVRGGAGGMAVYDKQTDTLYARDDTGVTAFDEVHLTRDGALLVISSNPGPALLWDFVTHPTAPFSEKSFGMVIAHEDFGPSTQMMAANNPEVSSEYALWDLAAMNAGTKTANQASSLLVNVNHGYSLGVHWTWQHYLDTRPAVYGDLLVDTDQTGNWKALFDEILLVYTDGSGYRRLAQHRSESWGTTNEYVSEPKGASDPSGRWYAYTSNWQTAATVGGQTRTDVYILKVPTEAEFVAGDYADTPNMLLYRRV